MGLDAYVRCRCIQDGKATPHPIPERLRLDESAEPYLSGDPSSEEWVLHDRWFAVSCCHGGYLVSERLGNISFIALMRELIRSLQGKPAPKFPILLEKVVYDGTHSGDWIPSCEAMKLLEEVSLLLQSSDILNDSETRFLRATQQLCRASVETGNPIMF